MIKSILILVLFVICVSVYSQNAVADTNATKAKGTSKQGDVKLRSKLFKSLMEDYESGINPDDPNIKFGISLLAAEINEDDSTLESNVWLRFSWRDSRLAWDTQAFPVEVLRIEFSNIWHPDVRLFNAADIFSTTGSCEETQAVVYSTGDVIWVPPCHLNSMCKTTLKTHPYEPQVCSLKFGSWTYDSNVLDIDFFGNETSVDMAEFQDLTEWKVLSTNGVKNNKVYPCCPEPYADLTFNLTLQRRADSNARCSR